MEKALNNGQESPDPDSEPLEPRERVRNLLILRAEVMEASLSRNEGLKPRRRPSATDTHNAYLANVLEGVDKRHALSGSLERALSALRGQSWTAEEQIKAYAREWAGGHAPALSVREAIVIDRILDLLVASMGADIPIVPVFKWHKRPPPDEARIEAYWAGVKVTSTHTEALHDRNERAWELHTDGAETNKIAEEIVLSQRQVQRILRRERKAASICLCGCGTSLADKRAGTKYHSPVCKQIARSRTTSNRKLRLEGSDKDVDTLVLEEVRRDREESRAFETALLAAVGDIFRMVMVASWGRPPAQEAEDILAAENDVSITDREDTA